LRFVTRAGEGTAQARFAEFLAARDRNAGGGASGCGGQKRVGGQQVRPGLAEAHVDKAADGLA
ncbi:MAG: hypothetical protein ACJ72A_09010, partial [Nocardioidaceae bacterium]